MKKIILMSLIFNAGVIFCGDYDSDLQKLNYKEFQLKNGELRDNEGRTPLIAAIDMKLNLDLIKKLIDDGANINARDNKGDTALVKAVIQDRDSLVKYLILKGADVNIYGEKSFSPIYSASLNCNKELVELLLSAGARLDLASDRDQIYVSSILKSCKCGKSIEKLLKIRSENKISNAKYMHIMNR